MQLVFNKQNKDIFEMVQDGRKKVETRAGTLEYQNLKYGDEVVFSCDGETFAKKISKVTHFKTISLLLEVYTPQDINPLLTTEEEIVKMYHSFPGYRERLEEFGIFAIEFA